LDGEDPDQRLKPRDTDQNEELDDAEGQPEVVEAL
jgi:hypothetical protein